jgi:hypothetical protein
MKKNPKQIKSKLIKKINELLHLLDFSYKSVLVSPNTGFTGDVKMKKFKVFDQENYRVIKVDISVKGYFSDRYPKNYNKIFWTKNFNTFDKKDVREYKNLIKVGFYYSIDQKIRMLIEPQKHKFPKQILIDRIEFM